MKIQFNNKIHFTSQLIGGTKIKKLDLKERVYKNDNAYFVELNPHDKNDINALEQVSKTWENDTFSINIYNDASSIYEKKTQNPKDGYKLSFYALTAQDNDFEHLNYKNILGVCAIKETGTDFAQITNLQVNPEYIVQYEQKPKYTGVGTKILKFLQGLYDQINLRSPNRESVRSFYIKNGFFNIENSLTKFKWIRK